MRVYFLGERREKQSRGKLFGGAGILDDIHLIIRTNCSSETVGVEVKTLSHAKTPFIFHLTAEI